MKPCEVNKVNKKGNLEKMWPSIDKTDKPIFRIGDKVRIYSYKKPLENKYKNNGTHGIFIVDNIYFTNPITY